MRPRPGISPHYTVIPCMQHQPQPQLSTLYFRIMMRINRYFYPLSHELGMPPLLPPELDDELGGGL